MKECISCGRYRNGGECGVSLDDCFRTKNKPFWVKRRESMCMTTCWYRYECARHNRAEICHYYRAKDWVEEFTKLMKLEDVLIALGWD